MKSIKKSIEALFIETEANSEWNIPFSKKYDVSSKSIVTEAVFIKKTKPWIKRSFSTYVQKVSRLVGCLGFMAYQPL